MHNDKTAKRKAKYGTILGGKLPGAMPKGKTRKTASNGMAIGKTYRTLKKELKVPKYKVYKSTGNKKGTGY